MNLSKRKIVDLIMALTVLLFIVTGCTYNAGTSGTSTSGEQNSAKNDAPASNSTGNTVTPDNKNSATSAPAAVTPPKVDSTRKKTVSDAKMLKGSFTKNVKFDAGKSSASFSAYNDAGDNQEFILGARAGQTLKVDTYIDILIQAPDGSEVFRGTGPYSGTLGSGGNYTVSILGAKYGSGDYTIGFTIN